MKYLFALFLVLITSYCFAGLQQIDKSSDYLILEKNSFGVTKISSSILLNRFKEEIEYYEYPF
jgi:hypothetical protein